MCEFEKLRTKTNASASVHNILEVLYQGLKQVKSHTIPLKKIHTGNAKKTKTHQTFHEMFKYINDGSAS